MVNRARYHQSLTAITFLQLPTDFLSLCLTRARIGPDGRRDLTVLSNIAMETTARVLPPSQPYEATPALGADRMTVSNIDKKSALKWTPSYNATVLGRNLTSQLLLKTPIVELTSK